MKRRFLLKTVSILCAAALLVAVGNLIKIGYNYNVSDNVYKNLAGQLTSSDSSSVYVTKKESNVTEDGKEVAPIDVNFELLREMNASTVGWLYCPGTAIDYPVVQSTDNEYYLTHLIDNQRNSSGAIFMDCLNNTDMSDANTIIYGHNMKNGSMFCCLKYFSNQGYFEKHPVMYYITDTQKYKIDVFASYETDKNSEATTINFDSEKSFDNYLNNAWSKSDIDTSSLDMSTTDNIITLSTCDYDYYGARYVVQGKITPID